MRSDGLQTNEDTGQRGHDAQAGLRKPSVVVDDHQLKAVV